MATQDLASTAREIYEAFNQKDIARCVSHAHPDARMTNMAFGASGTFREHLEMWARAFPDGKIEITNMVTQGDHVVSECIGRGTHTGALRGPTGEIQPTGRKVELKFAEFTRYRNGKLAEGRMYFDAYSLFTQLGIGAPMPSRTGAETQAQPQRH